MSDALREIVASFGVEFDKDGQLAKGHKQIEGLTGELARLGKGLIAAFAVDRVFEFGKGILEQADALAKQSGALGVSAEELQGWQWAAKLSGSSAEEFSAAFTKFTRNVNEASDSAAGPAAKAFKELGVSIKDASGQLGAPIDLLDGVVAGLENIQDPAKRTAVVMDLFGRSGARLLPLLSEGPEGIKKLRAEVGELGATFDSAFLDNAQEVNDNVDRLKLGFRGLAIQVIGPMLPELVELTHGAIAVSKGFVAWIKQTNVTRGVVTALGIKALPLVIGGLKTLGSVALRTVAPFLLLEDAVGFLAGDDSVIGEALDKIFGSGTGDAARKELLQWFTDVKNVVVNDLAPALQAVTESPLFKGAAKGALDAILAVLRAIGLALTDDAEKAQGLLKALRGNLHALGLAPTEEEVSQDVEAGRPENRKPLTGTESFVRKAFTSVFGDPLEDPALKAEDARNRAILAKRKAAPLPSDYVVNQFAPSPAQNPADYAAAFRPPVATAPAAPANSYVNNSQTTVAPVINTTVHVEGGGGDEAVGNRIGRNAGKTIASINTRVIKDALVPTPGG